MKTIVQKNRIKEIREEKGISSRALAKTLGTSAPHMSRLETGKSPLSIKWILKIAEALDVNSNEIIDLPLDKKLTAKCDDVLLGSVIGWLLEAAEKRRIKLPRQNLGKWASTIYNGSIEQKLDFKQTRFLAFTMINTFVTTKNKKK